MHPSTITADPTAVQNPIQGPPSPGSPPYNGPARNASPGRGNEAALNNGGPRTGSLMSSELEHLMEEPPGGNNAGRRASNRPDLDGRHLALDPDEWQAVEFRREGGWTVVYEQYGSRAGVRAHRGVLDADEYVDHGALRPMVEDELGFSYEQVRSVYRQGRLSADQRELRGQIDARLLALSLAGANIALLGRVLGFHVNEAGACEALNNALARARKEDN